ncbi:MULTISPECIES: PAS domain-containing sensor histidine kinase [unclassified Sinorhizobium]|uniref:PAS domain-containing protein n=1 Tax=unclassified Sinorhizobium TaxID=2613772 RepID=UPI0024C37549|nr:MULTISPECIES: PAS domain-containing sensor histidine kinase [unclassified Sinorhizobium]MDK1373718.1 PAS domain-containing protein [Sinorhizobium sp. 6-70]MDK1478781.1 PAS domain-containing protein [Sinorhizobium sp. 6-117]
MSSTKRRAFAAAISAIGAFLAWVSSDPTSLLIAVAAACICIGWKAGLLAVVMAGFAAAAMEAASDTIATDGRLRVAVFVASAFGLWLVVQLFRVVSFYEQVYKKTQPTMEDIPGLGWSCYPDGRMRFVNPKALEFVGLTVDEMKRLMEAGDTAWWQRFVHPDDLERSRALWKHSLSTGEPLIDEQRVRRHDGTYRWFRDSAVASRDEHGHITAWYGTTVDIDDQRKAEAALRESEQQLRQLIDTVPALIWCATPDGKPSYLNQPLLRWTGMTQSGETTGTASQLAATIIEAVHPDDQPSFQSALSQSFKSGDPVMLKYRLRRADGNYRWIDGKAEPLRDTDGRILQWYGVCLDIHDEMQAQEAVRLADERLARALRAASLSEMSVSIAHELNQPLQAIVANANAFQRWLRADPPNLERASRTAEWIIRDVDAAADVVNRIRALFTQAGQSRQLIQLNTVIKEVCELVSDKLQAGKIRLEIDLDPSLPSVGADRVQIEQVVINLVRNAIEAMHETPVHARILRIATRLRNPDMLEVAVSDRGHGIADSDRIFEAFFTTKKDGIGMGLAICRSVVETHGGRVWAENAAGRGATVIFSLPVQSPERERKPIDVGTLVASKTPHEAERLTV